MYYSNWKNLIVKPEEVDCICFKLNFGGGYSLKAIKDEYFVPVIGEDISIHIPTCEVRDALDFLKSNGYELHPHSVVKY